MSDRHDGRFALFRAIAPLGVAALLSACGPVVPAAPPVPPGPGTPCTRDVAVASGTVVIAAGACNPWCIHVAAGTPVTFFNDDPALYFFLADPPLAYEDVQVPGYAGAITLPLPPGTVTWTAAHQPAATVTVFVE